MRSISLIICLLAGSVLTAQPEALEPVLINRDPARTKILVVPFDRNQYFCQGDEFICEQNNISPFDLNEYIRTALQSSLTTNLESGNIYDKSDPEKMAEISKIYGQMKYREIYQPVSIFHQVYADSKAKSFVGIKDLKAPKDFISSKSRASDKDHRYFQARFADSAQAGILAHEYGASHILFISHFEMESRYKDCQDMKKSISQRDLFVHYTLFDDKGAIADGGVACLTFESQSSDLKTLIDDNFAILGNLIAQEVKQRSASY